jgi:hypothetical protein
MAPDLVRFAALAGGPEEAVEAFLGDAGAILKLPLPRESLAAMADAAGGTPAMQDYRDLFARIPDEAGKRVVGAAVFVNDRFAGLDLFPTNDDFRAHWPTLLLGAALHAGLIDRYAAEVGILFPAARDPDRFAERVKKTLRTPFGAVAREAAAAGAGTEISMRREGVTVRALVDADIVHAAFLVDPEEEEIPAAPPPGTAVTETPEDLLRRGDRARLTEAERRLLERMLERRGSLPELPSSPGPDRR